MYPAKPTVLVIAATVVAAGTWYWWTTRPPRRPAGAAPPSHYVAIPPRWSRDTPAPRAAAARSTEEKAARVEKIRRDYDELRAKVAAEYVGAKPSAEWLSALLQQLALLERERRKDLLTVLTPAELEELDWRESPAGRRVREFLDGTAATDAQKREVFRLQQTFEEQFGFTFGVSPAFLLAREQARQEVERQVRAIIGEDVFPAWLRGEGEPFTRFAAFAERNGMPASVPVALWELRDAYVVGQLQIAARTDLTREQVALQQSDLARRTELQVRTVLGPALADPRVGEVLAWLPKR